MTIPSSDGWKILPLLAQDENGLSALLKVSGLVDGRAGLYLKPLLACVYFPLAFMFWRSPIMLQQTHFYSSRSSAWGAEGNGMADVGREWNWQE